MDNRRALLYIMSGTPSLIAGLSAAVFPGFGVPLLAAAIVLLVGAIIAWAYLAFRDMRTEIESLKRQMAQSAPAGSAGPSEESVPLPQPRGTGWTLIEEIDLTLDRGWERTRTFDMNLMSMIRVTASGKNRFILHLARNVTSKRFTSVEKSGPTTNLQRIFESISLDQGSDYAIVVEPVGEAAFHVKVRLERGYIGEAQ